jgi:hypothetical protein
LHTLDGIKNRLPRNFIHILCKSELLLLIVDTETEHVDGFLGENDEAETVFIILILKNEEKF